MDDVVEVVVTGALVEVGEPSKAVWLVGSSLPEMDSGKLLYQGEIVLRASLAFLYSPDALIVQRIVDDFGRDYRGEYAIEFMLRKGDSFPRATVFGRRTGKAEIEQVFLKELDLARGVQILAYSKDEDELLAHIDTALVIEGQQFPDDLPSAILGDLSIQDVTGSDFHLIVGSRGV